MLFVDSASARLRHVRNLFAVHNKVLSLQHGRWRSRQLGLLEWIYSEMNGHLVKSNRAKKYLFLSKK
jgi:hypothetical protein